jgi:transcriptional regulator with XRE-family HTH domain
MGERVAVQRATKRMSQRELAAICEMDIKTVSRVELGEIAPSIVTLVAIAEALQLSLDYLVYGFGLKALSGAQRIAQHNAGDGGGKATAYVRIADDDDSVSSGASAYIVTKEQLDDIQRRLDQLERQEK